MLAVDGPSYYVYVLIHWRIRKSPLGVEFTYRFTTNIYIRPLSSVQNKMRFILHEPYDLSWPLNGRSLGKKHVLLRFVDLLFKKKMLKIIKSNTAIWLWLSQEFFYRSTVVGSPKSNIDRQRYHHTSLVIFIQNKELHIAER